MKQRTIVEMMLQKCPNCGQNNYNENEFCMRCGSSMVVREHLIKQLDEGIMPEAEPVRYPILESTASSVNCIPISRKMFYLGGFLFSIFMGFLLGIYETNDPSGIGFLTFGAFAMIVIISFFILEGKGFIHYHMNVDKWEHIKGVVLGYSRRIIPEDIQRGGTTKPQNKIVLYVQVFAKIQGVDTIVIMQAPDGVSEITHPRGTEVTIAGEGQSYIMIE